MYHKHNHAQCNDKHQLTFCSQCNVVYCEKCGEEWAKPNTLVPFYPTLPVYPLQPFWESPFKC